MKGYKGFEKGLVCKGKQYKENTVFEEDKTEICESGMHFCGYPLDVFRFYPLVNDNGVLNEFVEVEALDDAKTNDDIKYCTKKLKIGAKIGIPGLVQASVDYIINKISKNNAESNTGYCSVSTNTGHYSASTNTGNYSASTNTGYCSVSSVEGKDSVAIAFGVNSKAKGALGCYIAIAEWERTDYDCGYKLKDFQSAKVDGKKIKADTFYKLIDGEFTECE